MKKVKGQWVAALCAFSIVSAPVAMTTHALAEVPATLTSVYDDEYASDFDKKDEYIEEAWVQAESQKAVDSITNEDQTNTVEQIKEEIKRQEAGQKEAKIDLPIYVIQFGDELPKIADAYDVDPNELVQANNLKDPNKLVVGDILTISKEVKEVAKATEVTTDVKPVAKPVIVKPGKPVVNEEQPVKPEMPIVEETTESPKPEETTVTPKPEETTVAPKPEETTKEIPVVEETTIIVEETVETDITVEEPSTPVDETTKEVPVEETSMDNETTVDEPVGADIGSIYYKDATAFEKDYPTIDPSTVKFELVDDYYFGPGEPVEVINPIYNTGRYESDDPGRDGYWTLTYETITVDGKKIGENLIKKVVNVEPVPPTVYVGVARHADAFDDLYLNKRVGDEFSANAPGLTINSNLGDHPNYTLNEVLKMSSDKRYELATSLGTQFPSFRLQKTLTDGTIDDRIQRQYHIEGDIKKRINDYELYKYDTLQKEFANFVNAERATKGLAPIMPSELLKAGNQVRASELAEVNTIRPGGVKHSRPDGTSWIGAFQDQIGVIAGENTAASGAPQNNLYALTSEKYLAERFFLQWKGSPSHYDAMMRSTIDSFAFDVKVSDYHDDDDVMDADTNILRNGLIGVLNFGSNEYTNPASVTEVSSLAVSNLNKSASVDTLNTSETEGIELNDKSLDKLEKQFNQENNDEVVEMTEELPFELETVIEIGETSSDNTSSEKAVVEISEETIN